MLGTRKPHRVRTWHYAGEAPGDIEICIWTRGVAHIGGRASAIQVGRAVSRVRVSVFLKWFIGISHNGPMFTHVYTYIMCIHAHDIG